MQEKYRMSEFDAQNEAEKLKQIVETGQAKDYDMAEKLLQTQIENSPIVENRELGVSYRETVEELPLELQEQTGIKRLRRRKVLSYPDFFCKEGKSGYYYFDVGISPSSQGGIASDKGVEFDREERQKLETIWHFFTNDRFLTYKTWNHRMSADWYNSEGEEMIREFYEEEWLFQEFFPVRNLQGGITIDIFNKDKDENFSLMEWKEKVKLTDEEARAKLSIFPMSLSEGIEGGVGYGPTFVFGKNNKEFVDYIKTILTLSEIRKMMELTKFYDKPFSTPEERKISQPGSSLNIQRINQLLNEEEVKFYDHPCIPVVRHPDIKRPLRWCDAELAILPQGKELEIVFFETE